MCLESTQSGNTTWVFILQKKTPDETTKKPKHKQSLKIRADKDEPTEKGEETQSKKERKHEKCVAVGGTRNKSKGTNPKRVKKSVYW